MTDLPTRPVIVTHLDDETGHTMCSGDAMPKIDDYWRSTPRYLCSLCWWHSLKTGEKLLSRVEWEATIEVIAKGTADVVLNDPDQGDQKYSITFDDLPYPGEYELVVNYGLDAAVKEDT